MTVLRYKLKVDWNADGDYEDTGEIIDSRLVSWSSERGRDYASTLVPCCSAGKLIVDIDNTSEDYSSFNSSSPLAGNLLTGRDVRMTHEPPLNNYGRWSSSAGEIVIGVDSALDNVYNGGGVVEALIRPFSGGSPNGRIIDKATGWLLLVSGESNGFTRMTFDYHWSGDDYTANTGFTIPLYKFSRVSCEYNSDSDGNSAVFRVDGVIVATAETSTPTGTREDDSAQSVTIGNNGGNTRPFDGDIDDVRMWNVDRTAAELDDNKWNELVGNETGLAGYWKINEATGTTIDDATANNKDGTAVGIELRSDHFFNGKLERITPLPSLSGPKRARLTAWGSLASINADKIDIAMGTNILTSDALDDILDAVSWPAAERDINTGQTTMKRHFVNGLNGFEAIRVIERTENGFVIEDRDGRIRFEDRHFRFIVPQTTSQKTWTDATGSTLTYSKPIQRDYEAFLFNRFEADIPIFTVGSLAVLWTLPETGADSPQLAPSESKTFAAFYPTPAAANDDLGVEAWTTSVSTTDYTANSQSDGGGTDLTSDIGVAVVKSSNKMEVTLTNNHATLTAFVTLLQARGTPVTVSDPVRVISNDSASQTDHGVRRFKLGENFIPTTGEGQDWADSNVAQFKDPLPLVELTLTGNVSDEISHELITRDISDRITLVALGLGTGLEINEDFFVERIIHKVDGRGIHEARFTLTPSSISSGFWILGTSELSVDTVLAY